MGAGLSGSWNLEVQNDFGHHNFGLYFSDEIAHEREDMVARAVDFVDALPYVQSAQHVDCEYVEIFAEGATIDALKSDFDKWWRVAIKEKPPWKADVDSVATALHSLLKPLNYKKKQWVFNRIVNDEVVHVIELLHDFPNQDRGHSVIVMGGVALPKVQAIHGLQSAPLSFYTEPHCEIRSLFHKQVPMGSAAETLRQHLETNGLPLLKTLSDSEQILEALESGANGSRIRSAFRNDRTQGLLLASMGRTDEALPYLQREFDDAGSTQRPFILQLAESVGARSLTTGRNANFSIDEEEALRRWDESTDLCIAELRQMVSGATVQGRRALWRRRPAALDLDGTDRSIEPLWAWMQQNVTATEGDIDTAPLLPLKFCGHRAYKGYGAERAPIRAQRRRMAELLAAYLGQILQRRVPNAKWALLGTGELGMAGGGVADVLVRVLQMIEEAERPMSGKHHAGMLVARMEWMENELRSSASPRAQAITTNDI